MAEHVRLVIWDLDDTFWSGTLTEGGITQYIRANHDIVVELARRGIISSICSRNDYDETMAYLRARGIAEYFVFPSISWEPKGARIARLIEAVQLRPASVMFIDNESANRAEAGIHVPDIQLAPETFIADMLADPRFQGGDDPDLTRLRQYQLLETRQARAAATQGTNDDFLRQSSIRVCIEYDVLAHADRVIELVNRTNQLNYTKSRFPEGAEQARAVLIEQLQPFDRLAGLVRVVDAYGDYGFVGFFMLATGRERLAEGAADTRLIHFCFSCRVLGMMVEQWLYTRLRRPELTIVGNVLTPLSGTAIDWITEVPSLETSALTVKKIAPQIVMFGGCEANSIGVYLQAHTDHVRIFGNYVANGLMMRVNYARRLLNICDRDPAAIADELVFFGLPTELETGDILGGAPPGTVFAVNFGIDSDGGYALRHRQFGWSLNFEAFHAEAPLMDTAEEDLDQLLDERGYPEEQRAHILKVARHLRANYEVGPAHDGFSTLADTREVIERIPQGCKLVIILEQELRRDEKDETQFVTTRNPLRYRALIESLAADYPYVATVAIAECMVSRDEIFEANHYHRAVYHRIAERILKVSGALPGRATVPDDRQAIIARAQREVQRCRLLGDHERSSTEMNDYARAVYQVLLRREPEEGAAEAVAEQILAGQVSPGDYLRFAGECDEFREVWGQEDQQTR